jgi:SpoVK/Ycf46/Vps4 family AAA+-type ATPase
MVVDVPQIKSKWVGDSEKNIKALFDRYRELVKKAKQTPILLFNEADAIIGIRQQGAQRAVEKMENSIQNIILQEMETLDGIMIATTNLTQNLDTAFERRFLYKINFVKPDAGVRQRIWQTMMPSLSESDARALATSYDFSGGQIENITRKATVNAILHGDEANDLARLTDYCNAERLDGSERRKVGF